MSDFEPVFKFLNKRLKRSDWRKVRQLIVAHNAPPADATTDQESEKKQARNNLFLAAYENRNESYAKDFVLRASDNNLSAGLIHYQIILSHLIVADDPAGLADFIINQVIGDNENRQSILLAAKETKTHEVQPTAGKKEAVSPKKQHAGAVPTATLLGRTEIPKKSAGEPFAPYALPNESQFWISAKIKFSDAEFDRLSEIGLTPFQKLLHRITLKLSDPPKPSDNLYGLHIRGISWTPDGHTLVVPCDEGGGYNVWDRHGAHITRYSSNQKTSLRYNSTSFAVPYGYRREVLFRVGPELFAYDKTGSVNKVHIDKNSNILSSNPSIISFDQRTIFYGVGRGPSVELFTLKSKDGEFQSKSYKIGDDKGSGWFNSIQFSYTRDGDNIIGIGIASGALSAVRDSQPGGLALFSDKLKHVVDYKEFNWFQSADISPDSEFIAVLSQNLSILRDMEVIKTLDLPHQPADLARHAAPCSFDPSGRFFAYAYDRSGDIYLLSQRNYELIGILPGNGAFPIELRWSYSGRFLAALYHGRDNAARSGTLTVWDCEQTREDCFIVNVRDTASVRATNQQIGPGLFSWHPDSDTLAVVVQQGGAIILERKPS